MTVRVRLIRPDDLLNLLVEAGNMRLDTSDPGAPVLVVDDPEREAYLAVGFPPQTVVEQAVFEQPLSPVTVPTPPPPHLVRPDPVPGPVPGGVVASRIAGDSRLVFTVPADATIPYTVAGLLDWTGLEARLAPLAAVPVDPTAEEAAAAPGISAPEGDRTQIELPYRIVLSPTTEGRWIHRTQPVTAAGRTELWHTRLGYADGDGDLAPASRDHPMPVRAIWSPDYGTSQTLGQPDADWGVLTATTPRDRHEIVVLTSAFGGYLKGYHPWPTVDRSTYQPAPVDADQLMLSALGGWLTSRGGWDPPMPWVVRRTPFSGVFSVPGTSLNVSEWVHNATQGRDHYVRIVYEGVVAPFGHRAALIKVTERKIRNRPSDGSPVAFLSQRMFVIIREPFKDYAGEREDPVYARRMPFRNVRLTTLITPDLLPPIFIPGSDALPTEAFWVTVSTGRFRFNAVAEDVTGRRVDFSTTLVFIPFSSLDKPTALEGVRRERLPQVADRACPVPGQQVTYAEPLAGGETDNTTQVTEQLHFDMEVPAGGPLRFRPTLLTAYVRLPAVEQLLGTAAATQITLEPSYVAGGFGATASGLYAVVSRESVPGTFVQDTLGAAFAADQAGGVATPNLSVSALTRQQGPVAGKDIAALADDQFDPAQFFGDVAATAQLFGTFGLVDLLEPGSLGDGAPKVQLTTDTSDPTRPKVIATLTFAPRVRPVSVGIASFTPGAGSALTVTGRVERVVEPPGAPATPPVSDFHGELTDFVVSLADVIDILFERFTFHAASGAKPTVDVGLANPPVRFTGDLEFVNELQKILPPGLFGDGASLDVSPEGVRAGFSIGLPALAIGIFSLEGIALGASLTLPFTDGKPLLDFAVSSREHPFCLTVAFLGGGGFFHLQVDTEGVRFLEAGLEFGAALSVNLGVASGGVHVMAGIYFAVGKRNGTDVSILSGYFRLGGELSVLGLISVSLEFVLSFGYENGKAAGRATLTVKVEIAFFSTSVDITVEKKFGGSGGDPRFADVIESAPVWSEYASAFA